MFICGLTTVTIAAFLGIAEYKSCPRCCSVSVSDYGDFVKCTHSHNGAAWAVKLGYKNVYRYPGAIFAWKGADYPMEKPE